MEEGPRFVWLLTYQNHAWYEQNEPEYDTVHVTEDPGEQQLTEQLNEYMTSLEMSAEAIRELTEHFEKSERPVIICMLGDHAPVMINHLECGATDDDDRREILARMVPWMIWSNSAVGEEKLPAVMSTFFMPATLTDLAGIPLPLYYEVMLKVREQCPVFTGNGVWMDPDGNVGNAAAGANTEKYRNLYYYMEYRQLTEKG